MAPTPEGPAGARVPDTAELYRLHARTVAGWAARLLGPGVDVDDVVHEVFVVVQRRLPAFRPDARVTTWLYEITLRVVRGWRRRAFWRRWLRLPDRGDAADVPSESAGPLQVLEAKRATELVYRALDRLRESDRTLLILFEIEGLSGQEIAGLTGVSLGTVWVRLHRARARFLEQVGHVEQERAP